MKGTGKEADCNCMREDWHIFDKIKANFDENNYLVLLAFIL